MADNYLENQYEQYQARKAAWEREHKYGKKKKKSAYPHPLPQQKDAEDVLSVPDEENDNIPYIINTDNDSSERGASLSRFAGSVERRVGAGQDVRCSGCKDSRG